MDGVIDKEQSGFMPGRNISNNTGLILDMMNYNQYIFDDSCILFGDFYKAFDTMNHQFMIKNFKSFGFRNQFLKAVKTLYKWCNSWITFADGATSRFDVCCGIT